MNALNSRSNKDFMPTDDELLQKFLYNKINNNPIPDYLNILEYDLFGTNQNPLDIWNEFEASYSYGGKDLYFFTTLKKKSATSTRSVRTIGNGNWEGEDTGKNIFAKDTNQLLGLKKRFRFEKSNTPQDGGWILHEYNLDKSLINNTPVNNYVLCRFRKNLKSESQNTHAKASIADKSNSHLRKISRTNNCCAKESKEKTMIPKERQPIIPKQQEPGTPKQVESVISENNVLVKKYIIYEEAITQLNDGDKRMYEDDIKFVYNAEKRKCISTWLEEKRFSELRFLGENIAQNPKNQVDRRNSKTKVVERTKQIECNFNKEDDNNIIMNKEEGEEEEEYDNDEMSWPELFANNLLEINEGEEFIKEDDIEMLNNSSHKNFFVGK
ncbi:NAC domain-containing protein 19-like [Vicia villosa]|uniref:NAC domain-containing protein 19-like n=1 Tax=Vicia villosa TaxID=3911 RepID=UPI00273AEB60|nr:NAC domain-containing protein 19-like [Vicia villosa]